MTPLNVVLQRTFSFINAQAGFLLHKRAWVRNSSNLSAILSGGHCAGPECSNWRHPSSGVLKTRINDITNVEYRNVTTGWNDISGLKSHSTGDWKVLVLSIKHQLIHGTISQSNNELRHSGISTSLFSGSDRGKRYKLDSHEINNFNKRN